MKQVNKQSHQRLFLGCIGLAFALLIGCSKPSVDYRSHTNLRLWYDRPAEQWEETLPLGNGRLGLMPDGQVEHETIVLNDISLWSGGEQDANNPEAAKFLPEIQKLLFEGRNDLAQDLVYKTFVCKGRGSSGVPYGSYEVLGSLHIDYSYPNNQGKPQNYQRELSLNDAIANTTFMLDQVKYTREYFADLANDVIIVKLHASQPGALNFQLWIDRPAKFEVTVEGDELLMKGQLDNGTDGKGMMYNARTGVKLSGKGTVKAVDNQLHIENAQEAIIIVSATTNYKNPNFETQCSELLHKAKEIKYATLKDRHIQSYQSYFNRTSLNLEANANKDTMPTNRRLIAFASDPNDNGLIELYFQYGRYLLISSTRPNGLPPNLQGLWANSIRTPWKGDYHLNINVQMNHWPVEVANLPELHRPLINLTKSLAEPGKKTAQAFYHADGWVAHMMTNIWGFTAPGEHPSWGATNTGGAWLCAHLWDHYDFGRDSLYLSEIYPTLKGAGEFFLNILVPEPKHGWLVTAPTTSPENSFYMPGTTKEVSICMGSTMDNQLVRELFENLIKASQTLNIDEGLRIKLQDAVKKLPPTQIGSDGRIMEWLEEYEEVDPHHRHVSQLYGLHPGNQIIPSINPDLSEAARKTLEHRGNGGTGWSRAWKINFWARLGDGDQAYELLHNLLEPAFDARVDRRKSGTLPNLFCAHPPFQIDGNFGGCAGIAEMLLQSHSGIIELLPALPTAFRNGSFDRMRVRGGAEISAAWSDFALTSVLIKATNNNTFKLKIPDNRKAVFTKNGKNIDIVVQDGIADLPLKNGETVQIVFSGLNI